MIGGIFSWITFKFGNVRMKLGRHRTPIGVMEKRIVDKLIEIREAQTSHIKKQGEISGHTYIGSTCGLPLLPPRFPPPTLVLDMVLVSGWEIVGS